MESVAVIGVGMMGKPIAHRLIATGHNVLVCDTIEETLSEFSDLGVRTTREAAACAQSDVILVLVNTSDQLRAVITGPGGIIDGIVPERPPLVVVMSTVAPSVARELGDRLDTYAVGMIDAPVSGGAGRAADGTLTVMVGGDATHLERARPVLRHLGSNLFHCGGLGAGEIMKALNNVLCTTNSLTSAEVFRLGLDAGMAREVVADILEVSTGRNFLTQDSAGVQQYFSHLSETRELWDSIIHLYQKDASIAQKLSTSADGNYPVIAALNDLLPRLDDETFTTWAVVGAGSTTDNSGPAQPTPAVRSSLRGHPHEADLDQLELVSARRALRLLHERIPPDDMARYLAPDLERSDAQWRAWAEASGGTWRPCLAEFEVEGITRQEFTDWWSTATDDIHGVMYPAFPEHYLFGWETTPEGERRLQVVEELGHVPFRMYCSYGPEWAPAEPEPGYDAISTGVGRLADGTEVTRFMTQVRQDGSCLRIKTGLYLISGAPEHVITAHEDQLLVEWTRWIEMSLQHIRNQAQPGPSLKNRTH
ncbi:MAG: NAD(P)-dependent oxidoreductase [Hyphomicrobiales bacterium]|nr:MAG: NAD(P)-dependent oxidoreductase [Hyphomicrobiales bacterium]